MQNASNFSFQDLQHVCIAVDALGHCNGVKGLGQLVAAQAAKLDFGACGSGGVNHLEGLKKTRARRGKGQAAAAHQAESMACLDPLPFGAGQIGPDLLPVVGAKIFAGDLARCGALDSLAVNWARATTAVSVLPLPYLHIGLHANSLGELAHRQSARAFEVFIELHRDMI